MFFNGIFNCIFILCVGLNINFFVICWLDCFLKNLNDNDISLENEVGK